MGRQLAGSLGNTAPYDVEDDEWGEEIDKLKDLLAAKHGNEDDILLWFTLHLPKFMELVPTRRRDQFLEGVRYAYNEGEIAL